MGGGGRREGKLAPTVKRLNRRSDPNDEGKSWNMNSQVCDKYGATIPFRYHFNIAICFHAVIFGAAFILYCVILQALFELPCGLVTSVFVSRVESRV